METRLYKGAEVRAAHDGGRGIEGLTAVFESPSVDFGGWQEVIEPGAFAAALSRSDPMALFNHDPNFPLGRLGAGTLELEERDGGLWFSVPELPTSRGDVLEAVTRGDVVGNSFAFTVENDRWETRDGKETRVITEFREIFDVGPVVYPAYPATVVSTRTAAHLNDAGIQVGAGFRGEAGNSSTIIITGDQLAANTTTTVQTWPDREELERLERLRAHYARERQRLDLAGL